MEKFSFLLKCKTCGDISGEGILIYTICNKCIERDKMKDEIRADFSRILGTMEAVSYHLHRAKFSETILDELTYAKEQYDKLGPELDLLIEKVKDA